MYNHSMSGPQLYDVLTSYISDGYLVLRQSHDFLGAQKDRVSDEALLHMSPTINDCIYRNMNAFRYFMIIDLDEVIVPRGGSDAAETLPSMISRLPDLFGVKNRRVPAYVFRNAYFFYNLERDLDPAFASSVYLAHRRRLKPSEPTYSVKSIIDSQASHFNMIVSLSL